MKFQYLLVASVFSMFLFSCKKKTSTPATTTTTTVTSVTKISPSFSAKIDGVDFTPSLISTLNTTDIYGSGKLITITGSANNSFPSLQIHFPDTVSVGTYPIHTGYDNVGSLYNISSSFNDMYDSQAGTGSIVITSNDKVNKIVSGTFAFTLEPNLGSTSTNNHVVTNGAFKVQYN